MVVLSLFDGMSCLQIAMIELGVKIERYYASEIDVHAIKQTQLNFPDTVQLGSVTEWRTWDIDWSEIDLIGAGSPCQGFSFAGKQLAFDDPRSKLFFVFVEILNHCKKFNPDVKFLLENVDMKKDHLRVISEYVGVFPVNINSNLVSAQNRNRWYWTNIRTKKVGLFDEVYTDIPQPEDEGILLRDILEDDVDEKYFISQAVINRIERKTYSEPQFDPDKTGALNTKNNSGQMSIDSGTTFISVLNDHGILRETDKSNCLDANYHKGMDNHAQRSMIVAMRGRNPENPSDRRTGSPTEQRLEPNTSGKTNCLSTVQKDNLVMLGNIYDNGHNSVAGRVYTDEGKSVTLSALGGGGGAKTGLYQVTKNVVQLNPCLESGGKQPYQQNRIYSEDGIMPALMTEYRGNIQTNSRIRRLTPTECSRLQTVPSWYRWNCSDTQQYRQLGNGWTVKVIRHILSFLPESHFLPQIKPIIFAGV